MDFIRRGVTTVPEEERKYQGTNAISGEAFMPLGVFL
jgi:hypothetical protein